MPPKKNAKEPAPSAAGTVQAGTTTGASVPAAPPQTKPAAAAAAPVVVSPSSRLDQQLLRVKDYYVSQTPQRTKLLDAFLLFLAVTGGLQLLYCILAGNYVRNIIPRLLCRLYSTYIYLSICSCTGTTSRGTKSGGNCSGRRGNLSNIV